MMDFSKLTPEQMQIADMVVKAAEKYGIDPNLLLAQAYQESGFNHIPNKKTDAFGVMQIRPGTAKANNLGDIRDLQTNIDAGARLMKQYLDQYKSPEAALLAYHQGPGVADQYVKSGDLKAVGPKGLDYVISIGEASGMGRPPEAEEKPKNIFQQEIPGLSNVLSAPPPPPPAAKQEPEEVVSPEAGAAIGAATSAIGQVPFTPEVPEKVDLSAEQRKAQTAEQKSALAQQRLQERTTAHEAASQAYERVAPKAAPTAPVGAPSAPVTPAGAPEGTPIVELGAPGTYAKATGPGSMVYNYARVAGVPEIEAGQALGMGKGEGEVYDLLERRRRGITEAQTRFPSEGWQENPLFGGLMTRDVTPKGSYVVGEEGLREVPVQEPVPSKLTPDQELARVWAEQMAAEQRLAEAQEMERLKNEAALAKRGMTRAQTVAEARQTRAEEAQIDLAAAKKAAPGPVAQALRPAEVTGAKAGQTGFVRRGIAGGVLGAYGAMSLNELIDRYNKGDRDPELVKVLMAATASGAAVLPAIGPKTSRLKGAGVMAAVPLMGYDLYKAFSDEEKRLRMEQELQRRAQQVKGAVSP